MADLNGYTQVNGLPVYTKYDITRENKTSQRQTVVLAPIHGKVYDLKKMYNLIYPIIKEIKAQYNEQDQDLPVRFEKAYKLLRKIQNESSSYLGLVGICKYLKVPNDSLEEAKVNSLKGYLKPSDLEENQCQFQNDIRFVVESIDKNYNTDNSILIDCMEICNYILKYSLSFEDKFNEALMGCQDNVPFPLPSWRQSKDMRQHLYPKFQRRNSENLSVEQHNRYIHDNVSLAMESMNETLDKHMECKINSNFETALSNPVDYHIHYCKVFINSCKSFEKTECLRHKCSTDQPDIAGTLINSLVDLNQKKFILPGYSKMMPMRVFLEDYIPFDCQMPCDDQEAWSTLSKSKLYLNEKTAAEVHDYFVDLVASNRPEFEFDTNMEDGDVAWQQAEQNVIKNDKTTEKQEQLINFRNTRTDLHNNVRKKRRRSAIAKYFMSKYYMDQTELNLFLNWANIMEDSIKTFDNLCSGRCAPQHREVIDKVALAELRYENIISCVPVISPSKQKKMKHSRDKLLSYFAKRYHICEKTCGIYSQWASRLEDNEKALSDLCQSHSSIVNDKICDINLTAIFTFYDIFNQ